MSLVSLIWWIVTSQNVRNCAMLFKVWKDRWVLTSYRDTLCCSLFGMQVLRSVRGYEALWQIRVENISRLCLICIQLDLTTGRKMFLRKLTLSVEDAYMYCPSGTHSIFQAYDSCSAKVKVQCGVFNTLIHYNSFWNRDIGDCFSILCGPVFFQGQLVEAESV